MLGRTIGVTARMAATVPRAYRVPGLSAARFAARVSCPAIVVAAFVA